MAINLIDDLISAGISTVLALLPNAWRYNLRGSEHWFY